MTLDLGKIPTMEGSAFQGFFIDFTYRIKAQFCVRDDPYSHFRSARQEVNWNTVHVAVEKWEIKIFGRIVATAIRP
jgi:hypothetical protein